MKQQHDKHVKPSRQYQPGDRVYLDASKIKTTRASKKLDAWFHGPFKVISAVGKSAYKLELPPSWTIHDTFHESKLKPAYEPKFPQQMEERPRPPPEIIDGEEEQEVEKVKDVKKVNDKKFFLVKWKGLPEEENTWEPEEHMENARKAVREYYKRNPSAIRRNKPLPLPPPSSLSPLPSGPPTPTPAHLLPLYIPHPKLYGWDDDAFDEEYRRKLERNWQRWKSAREEAYST